MNRAAAFKRKFLIKRIFSIFIIVGSALAVGGCLWFFRNAEIFKISDIEISGNKIIPSADIEFLIKGEKCERKGFLGMILPKGHFMSYKKEEDISETISAAFSRIKEVKTDISALNKKITISVSEREKEAIWCLGASSPRNCFWLDADGFVFSDAPDSKGAMIDIISDLTNRNISLGMTAIDGNRLRNIRSALRMVREFNWLADETIVEDSLIKEARVSILSGQKILISLDRDPSESKPILEAIISSGKWNQVDYVDLRIEGKGFYKLR